MNPSSPAGSSNGRQFSAGTPSHFNRTNPTTPKTSRSSNLASPLASSAATIKGPATPSRTIRQATPTATLAALSTDETLVGTKRPLSSSRGNASLSSPHSRHDDIHTDSDSLEDETETHGQPKQGFNVPTQVYTSSSTKVKPTSSPSTLSPATTKSPTGSQGGRSTVPAMLPTGPIANARAGSSNEVRSPTKFPAPLSPKHPAASSEPVTNSRGHESISPLTSDDEDDYDSYDDDFYSDDEEDVADEDDGQISRSTSGAQTTTTVASPTSTLENRPAASRHSSFGREQSANSLGVGGSSIPSSNGYVSGVYKKEGGGTIHNTGPSTLSATASAAAAASLGVSGAERTTLQRRSSDPSTTTPSSLNNRLLNSVGASNASKQPKYPPIPPIQVRRIEKIGRGTFGDVFKAQIISPFPVALMPTFANNLSLGGGITSKSTNDYIISASSTSTAPPLASSAASLLTAAEAHEICSSIDPTTNYMYTTDGPIIAEKEIIIAPDMRSQKDAARQLNTLIREIHVMQKLSHKNIVKYLGSKKTDNGLSIFMEIADGGTVGHTIRVNGKVPEHEAKQYIIQLLQGLEYLHQRRIVHRDLKGDNLFLMADGTLKVGDFGTSKEMQSLKAATDSVAGTPNFMAPEVIDGTGHGIQADIWSLACCIIQMITGKAPFRNYDNQMAIMFAVIKGKIAQELPNDVSDELKDFFKVCTFKNAADRWNCAQLKEHAWLVGKEKGKTSDNPSEAKLKMMVKPKDQAQKTAE